MECFKAYIVFGPKQLRVGTTECLVVFKILLALRENLQNVLVAELVVAVIGGRRFVGMGTGVGLERAAAGCRLVFEGFLTKLFKN